MGKPRRSTKIIFEIEIILLLIPVDVYTYNKYGDKLSSDGNYKKSPYFSKTSNHPPIPPKYKSFYPDGIYHKYCEVVDDTKGMW